MSCLHRGGYRVFVDALAAAEVAAGTSIHLSSKVRSVRSTNNGKVRVTTTGHPESFDAVIVATRPFESVQFLHGDHPAKALFQQADVNHYNFALWNQSDIDTHWTPGVPGMFARIRFPIW